MKYRVTIDIEVSKETMKKINEDVTNPEEYIETELGWSYQSFDDASIQSIEPVEE